MVATNLCVWLNVIIEETKHEILHFLHHNSTKRKTICIAHKKNCIFIRPNFSNPIDGGSPKHELPMMEAIEQVALDENHHDRFRRLINFEEIQSQIGQDIIGGSLMDECKRSELMGNLVQDVR